MEFNLVDWLGYAASITILISLTMSSILKLRWFNLTGSIFFATYGFMIGSLPTGLSNVGIAFINIYYMYKIYTTKESFKLIKAETDSTYFKHLYDVNKDEIKAFMPKKDLNNSTEVFYMLRDNNTAGILAGRKEDNNETFFIDIDYATPKYRDFKLGDHFFNKNTSILKEMGYKNLKTVSANPHHTRYLLKMGFDRNIDGVYIKAI